jgi:hypothetical protein
MRLVFSPTVRDIGYHGRDLFNEESYNNNINNKENDNQEDDDLWLQTNTTTKQHVADDVDDIKDIFNQVESNDMMDFDNIDLAAVDMDDILSSSSDSGGDSSSSSSIFDIDIPDDDWGLDSLSMDYTLNDDGLLDVF